MAADDKTPANEGKMFIGNTRIPQLIIFGPWAEKPQGVGGTGLTVTVALLLGVVPCGLVIKQR